MQATARLTDRALVTSWNIIWTKSLSGKPEHLAAAIDTHVSQFPASMQADVRARAHHLIKANKPYPDAIRELIRRGKATLKHLPAE